ncbi:biotin-dependent carboxyltransferase family protein [Saccharopolyspora karakumensis]|uniref:Biotin-dependent carboxyltransferase family protein n=1 Tax=Saccharopolyspora karakumensis TaxID=2530386 RepID=A0A4R5BYV9_9PSEU|nr:biotin-dependent carboxyltransferase family protein [Saccharopolyspora karakumensis]TDD90923.1 biotin-dependent carboxyltransferase family protein [Saccharopolyspora karakumensis]
MTLEVLATGPLATVQDLGRPGLAGIGVGTSGAADAVSLRLANRLVGNEENTAAIEVTFGGLVVRPTRDVTVALTGAPCPIAVDGRGAAANAVLRVPAGAELRLGVPAIGLRSYLAVRGGIDVEPVLGSRSTDVLSGLGPDQLRPGAVLPIGPPPARFPVVDVAPVAGPAEEVVLRVRPGPRADWFTDEALESLVSAPYEVTSESNRVGMRLDGPVLERSRTEELPSEGMVAGALQVPPLGTPTLFLADHPVTGGYPVIGVVPAADVAKAAQARPGQHVHFRCI